MIRSTDEYSGDDEDPEQRLPMLKTCTGRIPAKKWGTRSFPDCGSRAFEAAALSDIWARTAHRDRWLHLSTWARRSLWGPPPKPTWMPESFDRKQAPKNIEKFYLRDLPFLPLSLSITLFLLLLLSLSHPLFLVHQKFSMRGLIEWGPELDLDCSNELTFKTFLVSTKCRTCWKKFPNKNISGLEIIFLINF